MECPKHGPMQDVCGEPVCGTCYGENLLTERIPDRRPGPALESVYDPSKHRTVVRRKEQP